MVNILEKKEEIWFRDQLEEYTDVLPRYEEYADRLNEILSQAVEKHVPLAIVQARAKSKAGFADKALRKKEKYRDSVRRITDLCGARVITSTLAEVQTIGEFIKAHFEIDTANSVDVSQRLKPTEFGYRSVHYVVQFRPGVFPSEEIGVKIPKHLFPDDSCPMKAEIQVRTVLEHGWADFCHEIKYKSSFSTPSKWERELATLAAILEDADRQLSRIKTGFQRYTASYGTYMTEGEMHKKIRELEIVLEYDEDNAEIAHGIGKLAITFGDWQKAIDVLSKYVDSRYRPLIRDLGVAMCKKHKANPESEEYKEGQSHLEAASSPPNRDVDAIASLAGTWKGIDDKVARKFYRDAFNVDPSDPYPLGNYLEYQIEDQKEAFDVALLKPVIEAAIQRCRDQAEVAMNLPWAFYDIGKFYLFLERPYESLAAYAKAIQVSTAEFMISTSLRSLDGLSVVKNNLPGWEWARRLLLLGLATKFPTDECVKRIRELSSSKDALIRGPVVIVSGGCDASVERQMRGYRELLIEAFRGFVGTIVSGGTTAGISGLVGDVGEKYPDPNIIQTIGYVPKHIPADASIDGRYHHVESTEGKDFSPLEHIQYWIDLVASDISPSQVKLLGINGGAIAATEYRMALALGARVGIIYESGREADRLFSDSDWSTSEGLVCLPADETTIRAFVQ